MKQTYIVRIIDTSEGAWYNSFINEMYEVEDFNEEFWKVVGSSEKVIYKLDAQYVQPVKPNKTLKELKITTEKVLETAQKHPEAAAALKTMFPEAFKDVTINMTISSGKIYQQFKSIKPIAEVIDGTGYGGKYSGSLILSALYDWEIVTEFNNKILIAKEK